MSVTLFCIFGRDQVILERIATGRKHVAADCELAWIDVRIVASSGDRKIKLPCADRQNGTAAGLQRLGIRD